MTSLQIPLFFSPPVPMKTLLTCGRRILPLIVVVAALAPALTQAQSRDADGDEAPLRRLDVPPPPPAPSAASGSATTADSAGAPGQGDDEAAPTGGGTAPAEATAPATSGSITIEVDVPVNPGGDAQAPSERRKKRVRVGEEGVVLFGQNFLLPADRTAREVVVIFGHIIADGPVDDAAVAILGDVTINGRASEAVAVLGNVTINGEVDGDVVAVMGRVQLGPQARVSGEVVSVGGRVDRAPGAHVGRGVQQVAFLGGDAPSLDGLRAWVSECLRLGRPLGFGEHLGWVWVLAGSMLVLYLLLALVFPRATVRCAETLEQRPGLTVVTALLTALLTPVLLVLLAVTGIGPLLLMLALVVGGIFGKVVFITWLGRRITQPLGIGLPVLAALLGGLILTALYLVPFLGFLMFKVSGLVGLGAVVYTIVLAMRREKPPGGLPPPVASTPVMPAASGAGSPSTGMGSAALPALPAPPTADPGMAAAGAAPAGLQYSTLPRAGFWIRLGAAALDAVLIMILVNVLPYLDAYFLLIYAAYCVGLWKAKGTTIGGVICGLKVVRLDDRPVDWSVAVVRGLGGFLSLFVIGLGFIWVAFDDQRQSWHDKIAGTTIVRVPKGVSLI